MDLITNAMRALAFLSRITVPQSWFDGYSGSLADTVRGFPLAGIIIALPASLVLFAGDLLDLPEAVTALLAITTLIVTTGGLHEDGLADVADGFYGGSSTERRLEIMKDSSIGSYGTLALIISTLLRTALLATILDELDVFQVILVIIGTEAVNRGVLVKFWQSLSSVRAGGVADSAGAPNATAANFALIFASVAGATGYGAAGGPLAVILAACLTALVFFGFSALCRTKIGGQTGDTLGAMQQMATIALQLGLVIAL